MTLSELQQDIKSDNLKQLYVFTGEEYAIYDIYIKQIKRPVVTIDSIEHMIKLLHASSLLNNKSKVFKLLFPEDINKLDDKWDKIFDIMEDNTLIIIFYEIDKRNKFYKRFSDVVIDFNKLPRNITIKNLKSKINLCDDYLNDLLDLCDDSYSIALNEICKINSFAGDGDVDAAYKKLRMERIINNHVSNNSELKFLECLLNRDLNNCCRISLECEDKQVLYILALAYSGFRQLLLVKGLGSDKSNSVEKTGLNQWQVKNALKYIDNYEFYELINILEFIKKLETGLKIGKYDKSVILDLLILGIIGGENI